ncbi:MAG: DUF3955 domain-containing protein [Paracoccaceae bacterium]|jgi:flagellar biogenesis protein FliO
MKKNYRLFGTMAVILAIIFGLAEISFYGDVDANGVLQESFFMPLSLIFAVLGIVLIAVSFLTKSRG